MECKKDLTKKILILGCGGLGGFVIDELGRLNIGQLLLVDGDVFSDSNMNRQLLANKATIGKLKVKVYQKWLHDLGVDSIIYPCYLSENNATLLDGVDLVIDCVDNLKKRLLLARECQKRKITIIHGGIEEDQGQVMICTPDSNALIRLCEKSIETEHSTNSFSVATIASYQVNLAYKYLTDGAPTLLNKLVLLDLKSLEIEIINP